MSSLLTINVTKKNHFKFLLTFFTINVLFTNFLLFFYIQYVPNFFLISSSIRLAIESWLFFVISFLGQMTLLLLFPLICNLFFAFILPKKYFIFLSVISFTLFLFFLIADSITFEFYRMHYANVAWDIFKVSAWSQVIPLSLNEILMIIFSICFLFCLECILAYQCLKIEKKIYLQMLKCILFFSIFSLSLSYIINYSNRFETNVSLRNLFFIKATRFVPYYDEIFSLLFCHQEKIRLIADQHQIVTIDINRNGKINYPSNALTFDKYQSDKPNILIIMIDAWRYDAFNLKTTPNIFGFSKKNLIFTNHWSGGNCTKSGLFSFFYGLPINYWDTFLKEHKGPLLIDKLINENYQMKILTSAQLNFPAFDKTIFNAIKPLAVIRKEKNTIARDKAITNELIHFLKTRSNKQPFFSFLLYDTAHNYCGEETPDDHPFNPWQKKCNRFTLTTHTNPTLYLNRYLNAVHFVDKQIHKVLITLENQHLLDNTIIMITADHGEEINDNYSGYWEHASAYTSYQLHIPLLIHWPNQKPMSTHHFTTHYDIVPTLMTKVLHCQNKISDYAIGKSLFSKDQHHSLIAGSYGDLGIISENLTIRIFNHGDYELNDPEGHVLPEMFVEVNEIQKHLDDFNQYFYENQTV